VRSDFDSNRVCASEVSVTVVCMDCIWLVLCVRATLRVSGRVLSFLIYREETHLKVMRSCHAPGLLAGTPIGSLRLIVVLEA
jgi:hypothetical protein